MVEWLFQFFYGGTWMHVSHGSATFWVRKGQKTTEQHYRQVKRRFMNWPWTHPDTRSSRRWPIISNMLDLLPSR